MINQLPIPHHRYAGLPLKHNGGSQGSTVLNI